MHMGFQRRGRKGWLAYGPAESPATLRMRGIDSNMSEFCDSAPRCLVSAARRFSAVSVMFG